MFVSYLQKLFWVLSILKGRLAGILALAIWASVSEYRGRIAFSQLLDKPRTSSRELDWAYCHKKGK
jgi:hypothetical protein